MTTQTALATSFERAVALFGTGDLTSAEALCQALIGEQPQHCDALHLLGMIALQRQRPAAAVGPLRESLRIYDRQPVAHTHLANAYAELNEPLNAVLHFDRALELQPQSLQAWNNRGSALLKLQRPGDALESFRRALALAPAHALVLNNCGKALSDLGQPAQALPYLQQALDLQPDYPEALYHNGVALCALGKLEQALPCFERATQLRPAFCEAFIARGNALSTLLRHEAALQCFELALQIEGSNPQALTNRGSELLKLGRFPEAIRSFAEALRINPEQPNTLNGCGSAFRILGHHEQAMECFQQLVAVQADFPCALGNLYSERLFHCSWQDRDSLSQQVRAAVQAGEPADMPFSFLGVADSPRLQLQCAQRYSADRCPAGTEQQRFPVHAHRRIRVAYVSPDLQLHPVSVLMAGVFEHHDRERFEIHAVSLRRSDDPMARRLRAAFEHFVDVEGEDDRSVAALLRSMEIDIAIDLAGHTQNSRPGIFAHRPAATQIQHLGFPGTMGAPYVDYIVGDRFLLPESEWPHYSEQPILLPHCFQANDSRREPTSGRTSRAAAGLPEQGLVFCCFNNTYKISPEFFSIWMRLLRTVAGSVLWLVTDSELTRANLAREAATRGVNPQRLVFANRTSYAHHLDRLRLADLFLDTLPFNAGTTASDALWAGVPVLTCPGKSFAARMAGSLLSAIGLPELIAGDVRHYEALALELARDPVRLGMLRARLERQRKTHPLFDTAQYTRHFERALSMVHERAVKGERPSPCIVPGDGD